MFELLRGKKAGLMALVACICMFSVLAMPACSSSTQHRIMTTVCQECEDEGVETYEVEQPVGSKKSGGTVIIQADEPVYLCNPVFTSKNGSSYIPYAVSRYNMNDGEVKVTLKPGVYAFCLDRGDSSIGKLVVVSEDYSDVPEIKLK